MPLGQCFRRQWPIALAYGLAVALTVSSTALFGSLHAGFNNPDEPSHFLNSVFFRDYLLTGLGKHPMEFATNYYLHYPKLAIGH